VESVGECPCRLLVPGKGLVDGVRPAYPEEAVRGGLEARESRKHFGKSVDEAAAAAGIEAWQVLGLEHGEFRLSDMDRMVYDELMSAQLVGGELVLEAVPVVVVQVEQAMLAMAEVDGTSGVYWDGCEDDLDG